MDSTVKFLSPKNFKNLCHLKMLLHSMVLFPRKKSTKGPLMTLEGNLKLNIQWKPWIRSMNHFLHWILGIQIHLGKPLTQGSMPKSMFHSLIWRTRVFLNKKQCKFCFHWSNLQNDKLRLCKYHGHIGISQTKLVATYGNWKCFPIRFYPPKQILQALPNEF